MWVVNKESQNMQIHSRISPKRSLKPFGLISVLGDKGF